MNKSKKYSQYNEFDNLLEGGNDEENKDADNKSAGAKSASKKGSDKDKKSDKKSEKSEKAESKKASEKKEDSDSDDDPYAEPILDKCCCCDCVCSNENTQESTCCGCFPIKCGVVVIGIITVMVCVILFTWYFFLFLNEYIHWWYVLICLFLLCPLLVGSAFTISWFTRDKSSTRTLMYTSQILTLSSVFLVCVWNLIYFVFIYKKDKFYAGMGDIPTNSYTSQSKKNFIFTMLGESVFLFIMHGYFLCVTAAYSEDMHGPPGDEKPADPEEEKPVVAPVEDAKSNKSGSKKGSEKPKSEAAKSEAKSGNKEE